MREDRKTLKLIIVIICILVPALVAGLYILPEDIKELGLDTSFLPKQNAVLNSLTSILLVVALVFVKQKKYKAHKKAVLFAMALGAIFLLSYVAYHATTNSVIYGDINHDGLLSAAEEVKIASSKTIYYFVLISHVLLSIIVLPLVLFSAYRALIDDNEKHKKIVKFAYPIWLYVSITGVIVYFMISPYYA